MSKKADQSKIERIFSRPSTQIEQPSSVGELKNVGFGHMALIISGFFVNMEGVHLSAQLSV